MLKQPNQNNSILTFKSNKKMKTWREHVCLVVSALISSHEIVAFPNFFG